MSDLCIYELEDNVWDEFNESDDHIVPHPGVEYRDQFGVQCDSRKKLRCDVNNADDANKYSIQRREETSLSTPTNKHTMLEKDSWSHTLGPNDGFPTSCDKGPVQEVVRITSQETGTPSCWKSGNINSVGSEFCTDDPILVEKCAGGDNNSYGYQLSHISQTDDDLGFFDNDCEDKESSDLLYYGWPDDIGNFEDVDRMFRSCDSTFGLGSLSNEDDLCWFSSSHSTEGSENALKLGSKLPNSEASALNSAPEHHEISELNKAGPSIVDSAKKNMCIGDKISSGSVSVVDHSALGHLSILNGSDNKSISWNKRQTRQQHQSEGKRKGRKLENGGSLSHNGNLKQFTDTKHSFGDSSIQDFSPPVIQQHKQSIGSNSVNCMQTQMPSLDKDYSCSSEQTLICPKSGVKCENICLPSSSPKESSYASNQVQSMDSFHGLTFDTPAITRETLCHHQELSRNFKSTNMACPAAFYDSISVQKQPHKSDYENGGQNEIEGASLGIPAEVDSSNVQESSCVSSVFEEISLEATSFRQLQQVMEQLDVRTKLCIRDSLYRLARSAEQRHNCANSHGAKRDDRDTSGARLAEEPTKSNAFMDMETDTNPIDRSIAHLLFHRPSDPPILPANEALSLKSQPMIHGPITSQPLMTMEQGCLEEATNAADKSLLIGDNKQ